MNVSRIRKQQTFTSSPRRAFYSLFVSSSCASNQVKFARILKGSKRADKRSKENQRGLKMNKIITAMLGLALFTGSAVMAAPANKSVENTASSATSAPKKLTKAEKKAAKKAAAEKKAEAKAEKAKK